MRRIVGSALLLALLPALAGCGTIFNGTRQNVSARSAPDGASVAVEPGGHQFTTPASFSLSRKHEYKLTFTKEGYTPASVMVENPMNAGILILDILSGLIGIVVDASTGGWYNLKPSESEAVLTKVNASVAGPPEIRVVITKRKDRVLVVEASHPVGVEVAPEQR